MRPLGTMSDARGWGTSSSSRFLQCSIGSARPRRPFRSGPKRPRGHHVFGERPSVGSPTPSHSRYTRITLSCSRLHTRSGVRCTGMLARSEQLTHPGDVALMVAVEHRSPRRRPRARVSTTVGATVTSRSVSRERCPRPGRTAPSSETVMRGAIRIERREDEARTTPNAAATDELGRDDVRGLERLGYVVDGARAAPLLRAPSVGTKLGRDLRHVPHH